MNIDNEKLEDFLSELVRSQIRLSQSVKGSTNQQETLKNIKDINNIISLVYGLQTNMEKQKEIKVKPKSKSL